MEHEAQEFIEAVEQLKVPMAPCHDCNGAWSMSPAEVRMWENRIRMDGAVFPKRCSTCRGKRREARAKEVLCSNSVEQLLKDYEGARIDSPQAMINRLETLMFDVRALERRIQKANEDLNLLRKGKHANRRPEQVYYRPPQDLPSPQVKEAQAMDE